MSFFVIAIMAPLHIILPAKSPIEIDKSMIEASDGNIFDIDTEYILDSSTDIKNELQVDKRNDNIKMEDDDL